jgi:hypothetical protein
MVTATGLSDAALDDTVEAEGDDLDPAEEPDETSDPAETETGEQSHRLFLPVVGR